MAKSTAKRLELEVAYRFPMSYLGELFIRACQAGLQGPEVQALDNTYLNKPDANTSPRVRVQVSAAGGEKVILHSTKTKANIDGGNGVKWEQESEIDVTRQSVLVALAQEGGAALIGNRKLRLKYVAHNYEGLAVVNVYVDFPVTYDQRFIGPLLEVEVMLDKPEDVVPTIPKLTKLATTLLGSVGVLLDDSCRTLSEPPVKKKKKKKKKKDKK